MRDSVRNAFYDYNVPFEGAVDFLYLDVKGLVSIGVGILADPMGMALSLPLKFRDGSLANVNDIRAEWDRVKALGDKGAKLGHLYAKQFTNLHLDEDGLRSTVTQKLLQMEGYLARRFPSWDEFPADAQLGILSLSWACGPAWPFPKLEAAVRAMNWLPCVLESHMNEAGNPGLRPRNRAQVTLFQNAAEVVRQGLDPDVLYWPHDLASEGPNAA